ncbi:hypothetical protein E2C01_077771 [Portunus trituberculatus]|uniref:Uncharacterized protein n=1 Tax=Portunus trituberculatus TaxID=210409 RepID=A0A5B7IFB2_PORTR|nr:hypothetical protein [Portunus trituberculatus]
MSECEAVGQSEGKVVEEGVAVEREGRRRSGLPPRKLTCQHTFMLNFSCGYNKGRPNILVRVGVPFCFQGDFSNTSYETL